MTRFPPRITSRHNSLVARYASAARGDEAEVLLLDGEHLIGDALAAGLRFQHVMVDSEAVAAGRMDRLLEGLSRRGVDIAEGSAAVMAVVSPVRTSSPIVALAHQPPARSLFETGPPLVAIACDVQDPGNVGAIVRVAEAAGASGLILAGGCANPFGWKALRGSMGSAPRLPIAIERDADTATADARRHRCRIVATVPRDGDPLFNAILTGPLALLIGGEGRGLSAALIEAADQRVTIPMRPPVESLNVSVAAALLLYEARRQNSEL